MRAQVSTSSSAPPPAPAVAGATTLLDANDAAYQLLVARLLQIEAGSHPEAAARAVEKAASLACTFHTGRFADGTIENVALAIGAAHENGTAVPEPDGLLPRSERRRRVLHVVTTVEEIGGHTRMLEHWVRNDASSVHALALVGQGKIPIPSWLNATVASSGGVFPCESDWTLLQKASWLRALAHRSADLVVLHHFPFDVVPTLAFAVEGGPPVAVLNHADHIFWLGSSIADTVINIRTESARLTAERRFVADNVVLPIPLPLPPAALPRDQARRTLGIPADQLVLLCVARGVKYRPSGSYDFVATAGRILERNARAHLYAVGETVAGIGPYLRGPIHERMHFVGSVPDASEYRAAADIYIESFPFGSQTAFLEAALAALPVVPAYAPLFPLLVTNDDALCDLLPNPKDEAEYIEQTERLMSDATQRRSLGELVRSRLLAEHVGQGWVDRLNEIYRHTDALRHAPRAIPPAASETRPSDVSLSTWNILAERDFRAAPDALARRHAVAIHAGQVARLFDEYGAARRHAWRAVQLAPASRRAWRLLGLALLGHRTKRLKALLRL